MIDLHTHLLPAVDDGARTFDEAVAMCRRAALDGCEVLVATPHQRHPHFWNGDKAAMRKLLWELRQRVGERPRILFGAEIRVDAGLLDELDQLPAGSLVPLAESRYLLLEFGPEPGRAEPHHVVHEVVVGSRVPILAHPERIPWLATDLAALERLVELGALVQITAASLLGTLGRGPREVAHALVDSGLVHFVASDCHDLERRPPGLSAAAKLIADHWGESLAHQLVQQNPAAIIANQPLPSSAFVGAHDVN